MKKSSPRRRLAAHPGVWSILALVAFPGFAQAPQKPLPDQAPAQASDEAKKAWDFVNKKADDKDVFLFDYGVPSSPGLTLLGVDKDKITQSNSLKPFVLSLPGLLASEGDGKAVAFDASLGSVLISGPRQTYKRYRDGAAIWFRTRINLALYEGVKDDDATKQKASRVAIGVSSSILNSSDPLLARFPDDSGATGSAWIRCLNSIDRTLLPIPSGNSAQDDAAAAAFAEGIGAKLVPTCMKVADLAARLGSDLDLGVGVLKEGNPGKLSGFGNTTAVLWGAFRTSLGAQGPSGNTHADFANWYEKLDHWFMIGASGRVAFRESVATGDTTTPQIRASTWTAWVGLERYSKTTRFAAQIGQQRIRPEGNAFDAFGGTRTVYHASFDHALGKTGLWLGLEYGKAEGKGALKSDSVARVTLTFSEPDVRRIFGGP